jgi:hypothetical protein
MQQEDKLVYAGDTPKIKELVADFKACSPWADSNWNRITDNENIRFTKWPGQHPDGKKHDTSSTAAFPFDGASDTRIPLADSIINENVAICATTFWRAAVRSKIGGTEASNYAVKLADYFINTLLFDSIYREVELSEQYRQTIGWVALHPTWNREVFLYNREVKMQDLVGIAQAAAQGDPNSPFAMLPEWIQDPTMDGQSVEVLVKIYEIYAQSKVEQIVQVEVPPLSPAKLKSALKELRENQSTILPLPYVSKNQPEIIALKPWDEIFLPSSCTDVQRAPRIYRRVWMSEVELRSKILTDKWSEQWVEAALKHKGEYSMWVGSSVGQAPPTNLLDAMSADAVSWQSVKQNENLVEVIYACYRQLDKDNVQGIYYTVFHPSVVDDDNGRELFAVHGLLDYASGEYPYVTGQRENWSRSVVQSRGVPQIVATWQREIKVQRDGLVDHTSLGVTPPILVSKGAMGATLKFGPAVQNEVTPGREPKFMEIPHQGVPVALQLMEVVEHDVDNYFGRMSETVPQPRQQTKQAMLVQPFLLMWSKAIQQMLCLAQKYMPDAEFARITGAPEGWLEQNRQLYGTLDVELHFDVRELDPDFIMKQLEVINTTVIPGDAAGVIDRAKYTKLQLQAINPALAKQLVADDQAASQRIFQQVQNDIAMMFLGNEPQYVEMDPTAQTKLKYASQIVGANPNYQQALQTKGTRFAELMQKYVMNLQFSMTQEQNKQVGHIGVKPEMQQKN